jgi:hypothetical protein
VEQSVVVSVLAVFGDVEAGVLILARDPQWRDQADDPENDQGGYPGKKSHTKPRSTRRWKICPRTKRSDVISNNSFILCALCFLCGYFSVVNSAGFGLNLSALLRRLEPGDFEMLVVAEVFPATFREHHLKGHTIGEAEPAFPGLPRSRCAELVESLIAPHNPAPHHQFAQKSSAASQPSRAWINAQLSWST